MGGWFLEGAVFAIKELGDWDERVFGLMARWDAE